LSDRLPKFGDALAERVTFCASSSVVGLVATSRPREKMRGSAPLQVSCEPVIPIFCCRSFGLHPAAKMPGELSALHERAARHLEGLL